MIWHEKIKKEVMRGRMMKLGIDVNNEIAL
jgi:hypothetical protein